MVCTSPAREVFWRYSLTLPLKLLKAVHFTKFLRSLVMYVRYSLGRQ